MLDHRLHEFAWKLPFSDKVRNGKPKWLLRQVLYRHVPQRLIERPKSGFAVPLANWMRGELREWVESQLNPARIRREGYFDADLVDRKLKEHLSGQRNWHYLLWDVLMFQSWLETQ